MVKIIKDTGEYTGHGSFKAGTVLEPVGDTEFYTDGKGRQLTGDFVYKVLIKRDRVAVEASPSPAKAPVTVKEVKGDGGK